MSGKKYRKFNSSGYYIIYHDTASNNSIAKIQMLCFGSVFEIYKSKKRNDEKYVWVNSNTGQTYG